MLLPQLKPNQILILDNAAFHKGEKIRQLVESAGCELLYLPQTLPKNQGVFISKLSQSAESKGFRRPPDFIEDRTYSPDLNHIEHYWFPIKNQVKKTVTGIEDFRQKVDEAVTLLS